MGPRDDSGAVRLRVRVLCGAYVPSSPFIEGGCATDWLESFDEPHPVTCPGCRRACSREWVGCALEMLATRVVCVLGCHHGAITFSRRQQEPYFSAIQTAEEAKEAGGEPS